jgi:hypothetical protein
VRRKKVIEMYVNAAEWAVATGLKSVATFFSFDKLDGFLALPMDLRRLQQYF